MNSLLIKRAQAKLNELLRKFDGFNTVFLDEWRGCRFIYGVDRTCNGLAGCSECRLCRLLKNEGEIGGFTAGLYMASPEDKHFFGPQKFLNCKNFKEYQRCYVRFLLTKCRTRKEVFEEMDLVKNLKLLYSKRGSRCKREKAFRKGIVREVFKRAGMKKRKMVRDYLDANPDFRC